MLTARGQSTPAQTDITRGCCSGNWPANDLRETKMTIEEVKEQFADVMVLPEQELDQYKAGFADYDPLWADELDPMPALDADISIGILPFFTTPTVAVWMLGRSAATMLRIMNGEEDYLLPMELSDFFFRIEEEVKTTILREVSAYSEDAEIPGEGLRSHWQLVKKDHLICFSQVLALFDASEFRTPQSRALYRMVFSLFTTDPFPTWDSD